jgi:hypothetical protein
VFTQVPRRVRDERYAAPLHPGCCALIKPRSPHCILLRAQPAVQQAQYGIAGCELSNLSVNGASYSAPSLLCVLMYYVYETRPLAPVVGAIPVRVLIELQLFRRASVVQDSSVF